VVRTLPMPPATAAGGAAWRHRELRAPPRNRRAGTGDGASAVGDDYGLACLVTINGLRVGESLVEAGRATGARPPGLRRARARWWRTTECCLQQGRSMPRVLQLMIALSALGALAMTPLPSEDPVTTSTVVGEERCDGSDVVAEEHDACAWTMTTTTAQATPPVLEMRITTAAEGDEFADGAIVRWSAGNCAFFLDHDSGIGADQVTESGTDLFVSCGDSTKQCIEIAGSSVSCETTYQRESHVVLDRGVRDGHDLVWTLTFEAELAEWAPAHDRGGVLNPGFAAVGPRPPESYTLATFTCGNDTPCVDFAGDFISGRVNHTVG
jgi:membrane-bound inhibitor of C-type lysozyme